MIIHIACVNLQLSLSVFKEAQYVMCTQKCTWSKVNPCSDKLLTAIHINSVSNIKSPATHYAIAQAQYESNSARSGDASSSFAFLCPRPSKDCVKVA